MENSQLGILIAVGPCDILTIVNLSLLLKSKPRSLKRQEVNKPNKINHVYEFENLDELKIL